MNGERSRLKRIVSNYLCVLGAFVGAFICAALFSGILLVVLFWSPAAFLAMTGIFFLIFVGFYARNLDKE